MPDTPSTPTPPALTVVCIEDLPRAARADTRGSRVTHAGVEILPPPGHAAPHGHTGKFYPGCRLYAWGDLLRLLAIVLALITAFGGVLYWLTTGAMCTLFGRGEQQLCPPPDRPDLWFVPVIAGLAAALLCAAASVVLGAVLWKRTYSKATAAVGDLQARIAGPAADIAARADQIAPNRLTRSGFSRRAIRDFRTEHGELTDLRQRAAEIRLRALRTAYAHTQLADVDPPATQRLDRELHRLATALTAICALESKRNALIASMTSDLADRQEQGKADRRRRRARAIAATEASAR